MTCRILVVEDSATQAEALRTLLAEERYEVEVARSGEEARDFLAETTVDLILSDIVMPGMSGFDLCRLVKASTGTQGIPFVLLTSRSDPMDIVRGLECGADNYITKPYDPEHLLARLRHVLDNRRLRRNSKTSLGVSVRFLGRELAINSEKEQILDLFISSVEDVVRANEALQASRAELTRAHEQLAAFAKQKSKEARVSTERYRTLLENASDAIFVVDPTGKILELNRQAASLLGTEGESAVGAEIVGFIPRAQRGPFSSRFASLSEDGQVDLGVLELASRRGPDVLIEMSASLSRLEGEDLILLIARDVTEREHQSERLDDANRRLTTLIEASPLAIIALDREMMVELWNGAAEQLFGWTADEVLTRPYPLAEGRLEASEQLNQRLLAGESIRGVELEMQRKDGSTVEVSAYAVPMLGPTGETTRILVMMADVTERREAEKALQERAQAEEANRAKSEFLSRMSHELRTPLNAILGFAQLLEMDDLGAEQRESVGQILRGGRHLLDLINEVLDLSRIEAGRLVISLEPVALGMAVKHAIDLVSPLAAERGLLLSAGEIDPNLHVAADIQRLRQVLLNLLSNAVKYNRRDGTVRVEVKALDGDNVRISVQDSGFGIPESQIERLFRPFERLNVEESGIQGTGLGLVLARALTEAMGGQVGVESEVGQGSNFWLELPVAAPPELVEPAPTHRDVAAPASGPVRTVLYIEDNPSNLRLVERVLSSRKEIQLITAMHGSLGLELAEKHRPDLILLDLNLPDMVGEEVLKRLRVTRGLEKTPLVIVSADAIPAKVERFLRVGASAYLTKPFDVRNLLGVIDDLLAKGE